MSFVVTFGSGKASIHEDNAFGGGRVWSHYINRDSFPGELALA